MNFQDLLAKMKQIDENTGTMAPPSGPQFPDDGNAQLECGDEMPPKADKPGLAGDDEILIGEKGMEECGLPGMDNMPHGMMGAPKQQDNVTMSVSMNGSGAGGISDLMKILRNIEKGGEGDIEIGVGEEIDGGFQSATTEPETSVADTSMMTRTGRDLASKDGEAIKVNGGGNPMREALIRKLSEHYAQVKAR